MSQGKNLKKKTQNGRGGGGEKTHCLDKGSIIIQARKQLLMPERKESFLNPKSVISPQPGGVHTLIVGREQTFGQDHT